ncbi:uncharacterized protein N7496_011466 [Penicillium cataractarum]|uniref:Uncharacterized protein n=1 Tax=Penicillium cataractarum TaxID=2100454 RepID=A0A9W9RK80_9EURO|nr:uncharacterized protein N7496_011466 [Penicillium cataractarum]KAJ5359053.1 hypothetical protein N7496_011466 [Penicillium cataractarum]
MTTMSNHKSTKGIENHTHLGSSATDKLNKRLIRVSQYVSHLSQFPSAVPVNPESNVLEEIVDANLVEADVTLVAQLHDCNPTHVEALRRGYQVNSVMAKFWRNTYGGSALSHAFVWFPLHLPKVVEIEIAIYISFYR